MRDVSSRFVNWINNIKDERRINGEIIERRDKVSLTILGREDCSRREAGIVMTLTADISLGRDRISKK